MHVACEPGSRLPVVVHGLTRVRFSGAAEDD